MLTAKAEVLDTEIRKIESLEPTVADSAAIVGATLYNELVLHAKQLEETKIFFSAQLKEAQKAFQRLVVWILSECTFCNQL